MQGYAFDALRNITLPLLTKLGKTYALVLAGTLLILGFALTSIAPMFFTRGKDGLGLVLLGAGTLAMLTAIPIAVRATSCPKCGLRWLGYSMSHLRANEWIRWLFAMQRCPRCSYSGDRPGA